MPITRAPAPRSYASQAMTPLYMKGPFEVLTPMWPGPSNCVWIWPISVVTISS
jgi:hypothetical protein